MRRVYQKIYLTILASLLLVVLIAGGFWRFGGGPPPIADAFEMAGELAASALPPAQAPAATQLETLVELARRLHTDIALYDEVGARIAAVGRPLPSPPRNGVSGWVLGTGGPAWAFHMPDGRWIVARAPPRHRHPAVHLVLVLGSIVLAVAIGAFPIVRGLTRRLERLQQGVETLGAGNLGTRVKVEGRDEIARLATSFNRSAARIEELVGAHRMLLANASHELRTPLSRLRMGIELFGQSNDPKHKAAIERDIAELDLLIDEILLSSRLEASPKPTAEESIDLLGLAAEECARYEDTIVEASADGEAVTVRGERRLLARLIRNLVENAHCHGAPPVRVYVRRAEGNAVLEVIDAGSGIPEDERERVFTRFHRLPGHAQGTGLGLALVRQIARLHGGDAIVAPQTGGSCFRVTLPVG